MTNELAKANQSLSDIEQLVVMGDLAKLQPAQRLEYYRTVCDSVGLNPYTRPFEYITLQGKLTLYARKDATDQLRKLNGVSIVAIEKEMVNDVFVVMARAMTQEGRTDEDTGAVSVKGLTGDALANAMMKAITKAKRRVTLSICGLGWLDETEVDTIPGAQRIIVAETGEIVTPVTSQPNGGGQSSVAGVAANNQPSAEGARRTENSNGNTGNGNGVSGKVTMGTLRRLHAVGTMAYGDEWDARRHKMVSAVTVRRTDSSKDLMEEEAVRLINGIEEKMRQEGAAVTVAEVAELNVFDEPEAVTA